MIDPAIACAALAARKCLRLQYGGFQRVVEVHAVGKSRKGHGLARVYQVSGGSRSGKPVDWKIFRLDEAANAAIADEVSYAPRREYKRGDRAMLGGIKCQL